MRGVHFSLRWLFGAVSFLAVGCGLLIYASPFLSKLTFTAAVTALLVALFAAVYRSGGQRAFWAGFAAFGLAYLWMVCGTWQSPDGSTLVRDQLVTSDLLTRCYEALPSTQASMQPVFPVAQLVVPPSSQSAAYYADPTASTYTIDMRAASPYAVPTGYAVPPGPAAVTPAVMSGVDRTDFLTTGHSLFAIMFALLGGLIVQRCCLRATTAGNTVKQASEGPIAK